MSERENLSSKKNLKHHFCSLEKSFSFIFRKLTDPQKKISLDEKDFMIGELVIYHMLAPHISATYAAIEDQLEHDINEISMEKLEIDELQNFIVDMQLMRLKSQHISMDVCCRVLQEYLQKLTKTFSIMHTFKEGVYKQIQGSLYVFKNMPQFLHYLDIEEDFDYLLLDIHNASEKISKPEPIQLSIAKILKKLKNRQES